MAKKNVLICLVLAAMALFFGCDDTRTTEACLVSGDPECADTGTGGKPPGYNCNQDPNLNSPCTTSDGRPGHRVCTADGSGLTCQPDGGDGGAGGDGGGPPGPYNCAQDPDNGDPCTTVNSGPGHWGCNWNGTGLFCYPDGGGPGPGYNCNTDPELFSPCLTDDGDPGIKICSPSGTGLICQCTGEGCEGGGPGPYNCNDDPNLFDPCTTSDGDAGIKVCSPSGTGLVCQCFSNCDGGGGPGPYNCSTDPNNGDACTVGGQPGHLGCNATGTGLTCYPDGGGPGPYNCASDPQLNTSCNVGVGICSNTGVRVCNPAGDGLVCNVSAKPANPSGEICSNGLDDNCNGNTDESPCTSGGGGSGGDGGTGGDGGDGGSGGSGGSGGGATCTIAPVSAMVQGQTSLTTLLKGEGSTSSSNPLNKSFVNNDLLSVAAGTSVTISVFTPGAKLNYWEPAVGGGGDPMPLIDNLFCRQLGINPPTPASCNAGVIGDRKSAAYLSALRIDWECWRKGGSFCPSTIAGYVPGDLFTLKKIVEQGNGVSNLAAVKWGVLETPPPCP